MKVVVVGAGAVGTCGAANLAQARLDVVFVEKQAREAMAQAGKADWIIGDACEVSTLAAAGTGEADVLVAATGEDQVNLVASLLAKQEFAVPRVIARVNDPHNHWLFNSSWGVDTAVSTPHFLSAVIEEAVSKGSLVRLLEFEGGEARLLEVRLDDRSPALGRRLSDLAITRAASVVAVVRDSHVLVPNGDTELCAGDEVLVLTTGDADDQVHEALVGAAGRG